MKAIADVHFVESLFPEGCFIELFMIEKRDYLEFRRSVHRRIDFRRKDSRMRSLDIALMSVQNIFLT